MKTIKAFSIILCVIGLNSCTSEDLPATFSVSEIETTVTSGNWKITYFYDSDKDETNHFLGYTFTFEESGILTAMNGGTTVTGSWNVTDNSNDDSPNNPDFNILFPSPDEFTDLNDDWDILERTDVKFKLQDISGGNGGIDELIFEKL